MARDGEILNKAALQAAAQFLNLGGTGKMPFMINPDQVQFVYDLAANNTTVNVAVAAPNGGRGIWKSQLYNPDVGSGDADVGFFLLDDVVGILDGANVAARVDAIHWELTFDVAGALAFNGKKITAKLQFQFVGGDPGIVPILTDQNWATVATGKLKYFWSLVGGSSEGGIQHVHTWDGAVPAVTDQFGAGIMGLSQDIVVNDGTNLPANTTLKVWIVFRSSTNGVVPDR